MFSSCSGGVWDLPAPVTTCHSVPRKHCAGSAIVRRPVLWTWPRNVDSSWHSSPSTPSHRSPAADLLERCLADRVVLDVELVFRFLHHAEDACPRDGGVSDLVVEQALVNVLQNRAYSRTHASETVSPLRHEQPRWFIAATNTHGNGIASLWDKRQNVIRNLLKIRVPITEIRRD